MKFLFDIAHPAEVHYFKGLVIQLRSENHEVTVTARDKDVITELLGKYQIPFYNLGKFPKGFLSKVLFMLGMELKALMLVRKNKPDLIVSMGTFSFAHAAFIFGIPYIAFDDSEHASLNRKLYAPFAKRIFTPKSFSLDLGKKQFKFDSVLEMFYLHPNQFPKWNHELNDPRIKNKKFAILRFISWDAFHDIGQNVKKYNRLELVKLVKRYMDVYVSAEGKCPDELMEYNLNIPASDLHAYIDKASLYIGEGATTASECAMLGTPAIYINSLSLGYISEEEKWGLLWDLSKSENILLDIEKIIADPALKEKTKINRTKVISDLIDPFSFFYWYLTNYPASDQLLNNNPNLQYNYK